MLQWLNIYYVSCGDVFILGGGMGRWNVRELKVINVGAFGDA